MSINHSPQSTETPEQEPEQEEPIQKESQLETEVTEADSPKPWWKLSRKPLLGIGVFVGLSTFILLTAKFMSSMDGHMGHDMGGHDMSSGHDISGMSHDDMMRVDGAFNPTPVTLEEVQPAPLDVSVNYTGAIYPYSEVTVYPRIAGQLSQYSIYPGDPVEAGQILASLEAVERASQTNEAEAAAAAMRATVDASRAEFDEQRQEIDLIQADLDYLRLQRDRFAVLTAEGATSQHEYDLLASQVKAKEAMLKGANAKLKRMESQISSEQAQAARAQAQVGTASTFESYTQLTSPITGIVQARMADPGVVVQPGMGVFKIGDYQRVRLQANVAQQDANQIRLGTPILAQVPGANSGVIRGEITSIFPKTDLTTRTVTVEAVVDNSGQRLLSGQFVDMEIIIQQRPNALSIPQKALMEFKGEPAVWVVNGDVAQRRRVKTGLSSQDRIEITDGLKPGDQVITSGHSRLQQDSPVTIVDALGSPASSAQKPAT